VRKLVLVDGSAMIFRAYFAIPSGLARRDGLHTNATYGFAMTFRKLFAGKKPDFGAVVLDSSKKTFRAEKYAAYKATRAPVPDELREQIPWIDKVIDVYGFPRLRVDGFEADDVIATLATQAAALGHEVVVVSADKDFAQLVDDRIRMWDSIRDVTYDAELVRKKWGVTPAKFVDLQALVGDAIDNIPGVAGIGQKGAAQLLEAHGSLDGIYANLAALKPKQRELLETQRDAAYLSRDLARLDREVPLPIGLEALGIPPEDLAKQNELYRELQFFSLLTEDAKLDAETSGAMSYRTLETDEAIAEFLASLTETAAVFPLCEGERATFGELCGVAIARGPGDAVYLPGGRGLAAWLGDAARPKVAHDAKALWQLCRRQGIALAGVVGDTMLASFLVEPQKLIPHRLEQLTKEYLQRTLPPRKRLGDLRQAPLADVADHACRHADAIAGVWALVEERLRESGLAAHLAEHELPLAWVLGQMELDGVLVDAKELAVIGAELAERLRGLEQKIHGLAGREFNIGSTKQLAEVLFEELKLPVVKKTKTGYSTDQEVLEKLALKHEIAREIVEHRKVAKLINTYTDVLQAAVRPETGRIHASFQQTVSTTGRLICTDPDLQRTPIRTPEGRRIRQAFLAPPGHKLVSADWSQIELRLLAHVSGDPLLLESFRSGADVHRRTASEIFGCALDAVTEEQRGVGKTINFATIYGQGATALGQILGIPRKDAESYIEGYFRAYAGVRAWLDATIAGAHERGYVSTLIGRRRYIPELSSKNFMDRQTGERMAANTPIQGSAADLCKAAMLAIDRRLAGRQTRMLLQIHDELVFEAPDAEVEAVSALVKEVMENAWPLAVPLVVEVGVGQTWSEAH
jgi:DNA polymerase I